MASLTASVMIAVFRVCLFALQSIVKVNPRALGDLTDPRTIQIRLRGCHFHLFRSVGFNFPPIEERPQLPAIGTIEHLDGRLTIEFQLQPHFARPRQLRHKRKLDFLRGPLRCGRRVTLLPGHRNRQSAALVSTGAHLSRHRHCLYRAPSLQATSGSDVLGGDVRSGEFRSRRSAGGSGKRKSEDEGNKGRQKLLNYLDPHAYFITNNYE